MKMKKRLKENLTNILLIIVVIICTCILYNQNKDIIQNVKNIPEDNYKYMILEWTLDNDLMQIMEKLDK